MLGHPELAAPAQPAVEQHARPLAELAGDPRLVEPDSEQRAALVRRPRLHALAAPVAHRPDAHRAHGHRDRGLLAHGEIRHAADVAPVAVRVRQVLDQVAEGLDSEARERLSRGAGQRHALAQRLGARDTTVSGADRISSAVSAAVDAKRVTPRRAATTRRVGRPRGTRPPPHRARAPRPTPDRAAPPRRPGR